MSGRYFEDCNEAVVVTEQGDGSSGVAPYTPSTRTTPTASGTRRPSSFNADHASGNDRGRGGGGGYGPGHLRSVASGAVPAANVNELPASALPAGLSRPALLLTALIVQVIGIALPAFAGGVVAALVSATLFGATFLGVGTIVLAIGAHLQVPRAVAILATGYSAGQVVGPLAVTPFLHNGYHQALLIGAGVVAVAAVAAGGLRRRFPHHLGPLPNRVRTSHSGS